MLHDCDEIRKFKKHYLTLPVRTKGKEGMIPFCRHLGKDRNGTQEEKDLKTATKTHRQALAMDAFPLQIRRSIIFHKHSSETTFQ